MVGPPSEVGCGRSHHALEVSNSGIGRWFITGASRGLGAGFAEAALSRGDRVAAIARNVSMLGPLAEQFGEAVRPMSVDVTDRAAVMRRHSGEVARLPDR